MRHNELSSEHAGQQREDEQRDQQQPHRNLARRRPLAMLSQRGPAGVAYPDMEIRTRRRLALRVYPSPAWPSSLRASN
jgi:hypothetical protein